MKATITVSSHYGFDRNWTLHCTTRKVTKTFYLGQDVKFCSRVLGMSPSEVVEAIGTNRLDTERGLKKLAKFVCSHLSLDGRSIKKYQQWELCAQ